MVNLRSGYLVSLLLGASCTNFPFDSLERGTITQLDGSRDGRIGDSGTTADMRIRDMLTKDSATLDSFVNRDDAISDERISFDSRNNLDGENRLDRNYDLNAPDAGLADRRIYDANVVDVNITDGRSYDINNAVDASPGSDSRTSSQDLGRDLGTNARSDLGNVVGVDRIVVNFPDSNYDAPNDAGVDAPSDLGLDLAADVRNDFGRDLGPNVRNDLGADIGPDGFVIRCPASNIDLLMNFEDPAPLRNSCGTEVAAEFNTSSTTGATGFGQARRFNGTNAYLEFNDSSRFRYGFNNFTMGAMFRTTATPRELDTILGNLPTTGGVMSGFGIAFYSGGWSCFYWDRGATSYLPSGVTLNDGAWHSVECRRSNLGGDINIIVDDSILVTGTVAPTNVDGSGNLMIGKLPHSSYGYFNGDLDRVFLRRD